MQTSSRLDRIRKMMTEKEIDTVLISNFENQYYFSGLKAITYSRPILLKISQDDMSIVIQTLEENHAKHVTGTDELFIYHKVEGKVVKYLYIDKLNKVLNTILSITKDSIMYRPLPTKYYLML